MKGKKRTKIRPTPATKKAPVNAETVARVKELLDMFGRRVRLAAAVDQNESRISEWLSGKRAPTPGDWIRLGKLALEYGLAEPFFFWEQAGIDSQTVMLMAGKIVKGQYELVGNTVPVRRFRFTEQGREEAGPPIPLPAEFIPNPLHRLHRHGRQGYRGCRFARRGLHPRRVRKGRAGPDAILEAGCLREVRR